MSSKLQVNNTTVCLIVLCLEQIALAVAPECPRGSFIYKDVRYEDQGFGDLTGFYDWLRNPEGEVIGVRYLPADELDFICDALAHLPYAKVDRKSKSIELYFSTDTTIVESISNDQDFGDNSLFKSSTETYALSFNASEVLDSLKGRVAQHPLDL